jgi:hypothetical protein
VREWFSLQWHRRIVIEFDEQLLLLNKKMGDSDGIWKKYKRIALAVTVTKSHSGYSSALTSNSSLSTTATTSSSTSSSTVHSLLALYIHLIEAFPSLDATSNHPRPRNSECRISKRFYRRGTLPVHNYRVIMGQNSSRHHHSSPPPRVVSTPNYPHDNPTTATANPLSSDSTVLNVTPSPGSRRSSVRKSILNLVKPSARSRVDSTASSKRKSWRSSKRWSKAPPVLNEPPESSSSPSAGPSTVPTTPTLEKETEVEHDAAPDATEEHIDANDRPSTPFPPTLTELSSDFGERTSQVDHEVSQNIGAWLSAQGAQQALAPDVTEDREEVVISPDQFDVPPPEDHTPSTQPESTPAPQPDELVGGRQFPPPGTLVVVQGVVHTTDVPRNPVAPPNPEIPDSTLRSSSVPPNPSGTTRNRLSALLRSRPTSMITPQLSSAPSASSTTTDLIPDPTQQSENFQPAPSTHSQSRANLPHTDPPAPPTEASPPSEFESRGGTISSSSIDVLGTLLRYYFPIMFSVTFAHSDLHSVAAAATAASLLTGSSEPILSSGLAPPYSANGPTSNSSAPNGGPWTSRPTSPTPTAGLGMGDATAAGRAERLRHAWGSIRERLGLRPTPHSGGDTPTNDDSPSTLPASTDPRELMLAQMARAFNLGFGLNGEGPAGAGRSQTDSNDMAVGEQNAEEPTGTSDTTSPQLPPEGSFERFLVDLQVDLREALTSPNGLAGDSNNGANQPTSTAIPVAPDTSSSNPIIHPREHSDSVTADYDEMPMLEDVSDSESEFADDDSSHEFEGLPGAFPSEAGPSRVHVHSQRQPHAGNDNDSNAPGTSGAAGFDHNTVNGSGPQTGGPGRINWWRLYRFPPIMAPRAQGAAGVAADAGSPLPSGSTATSSPNPGATPPIAMDPTLAELPFAHATETETRAPPPTQTVIPVIVVGLQSVNSGWQQRGQGDDDEPLDMFGEGGDSEAGDEELNDDGMPNFNNGRQGAEGTGRTRGRAWHSRAAEAIRNLRHGRRNRAAPTTALPGSRTFLIYVIGGYYPPNHSIVTGGPNSLDSFEALL